MICEVCRQKNADIVFKTVSGNQVATKAMCLSCAHSLQQDMIKMFMSLGFKQEQFEQEEHLTEQHDETMPRYLCASCGRPYDSLNENTMAGCASCYDAMRDDLDKAFHDMRADGEPQTDNAAKEPAEKETVDGITDLRYRLMEAVINERFEEAAQLRDEINRLTPLGEQA